MTKLLWVKHDKIDVFINFLFVTVETGMNHCKESFPKIKSIKNLQQSNNVVCLGEQAGLCGLVGSVCVGCVDLHAKYCTQKSKVTG